MVERYFKPFLRIAFSISALLAAATPAHAQLLPKNFTIEGRLFQADGVTPYAGNVDVMLDLVVQGNPCVIYREEHLNLDVDAVNNALDGVFALKLGTGAPPAAWAGVTNIVPLFNAGTLINGRNVVDSAGCTVTPVMGGHREVQIHVQATGVATYALRLASYEVLGPNNLVITTVPGALMAETLQGLVPTDLIRAAGNRTEANIDALVNSADAGSLHHHDARYDARYVPLSGTTAATNTVGIGTTSTAIGHLEIWKPNPTVYMNVTGTGLTSSLIFAGLGTPRAKIEAAVGTNGLKFYNGANALPSLEIDAASNLLVSGSLDVEGTVSVGRYNNAQETGTLVPALAPIASGTIWYNTDSNELKVWNGGAAVSLHGISALTGDVTSTGPGSAAATISNAAVTTAKVANNAITPSKINTVGLVVNKLVSTAPVTAADNLVYAGCVAGEVMTFNASGQWSCTTPRSLVIASGLPPTALDQAGAGLNQVLKWNGSFWVPSVDMDSGDVTQIVAEAPLTGGGVTGVVTIGISVGTAANQVVGLNGSAQLPSVDGSLLTDVNAVQIQGEHISSSSPLADDYLVYNDLLGEWEPRALPVGISADQLVAYDGSGNIGIASGSPRGRLDVDGTILGKPAVLTGSPVNFANGNIHYTTGNCGAFALHNMRDGGTYTFAVKGTVSATCTFTAFSDAGVTGLSFHYPSGHSATMPLSHTLYNFIVIGTDVYASWSPGI